MGKSVEANLGTIRQDGVWFEDGRVTALEQFYLNGPIPPELGRLVNLTYLDLRANPLTGCFLAGWRDRITGIQPSDHPPFCTD